MAARLYEKLPTQVYAVKLDISDLKFNTFNSAHGKKVWADLKAHAGDHVRVRDGEEGETEVVVEVYDFLHETWIKFFPGDYIIKGVVDEFYPCNEETFHMTYREVEEA